MKKNILIVILSICLLIFGASIFYKSLEVNLLIPGNCIEAKSKCNICILNSNSELKKCSNYKCENEKFYCTKYKSKNGDTICGGLGKIECEKGFFCEKTEYKNNDSFGKCIRKNKNRIYFKDGTTIPVGNSQLSVYLRFGLADEHINYIIRRIEDLGGEVTIVSRKIGILKVRIENPEYYKDLIKNFGGVKEVGYNVPSSLF